MPAQFQFTAEFSLETGLRRSKIAGLQRQQVSLPRRKPWVRAHQVKGGATPICMLLSDRGLRVPRGRGGMHDTAVFPYHGRAMGGPKTALRAASARAGLAGVTWPDLRYSWASWHDMAGTPLEVLERLGGWNSTEMAQRYDHLAPDYVAQWANNAKAARHGKRAQRVTVSRKSL
jgi:integrase